MGNPNDRQLITGAGISMASSFVLTPWVLLTNNIAFSFQMNWTGSPVGTFSVQFSNDTSQFGNAQQPTQPIPYAASNTLTTGISGCTIAWTDAVIPNNWVQLVYTSTSGSGLLTSVEFNGR